MKTFLAVIIVVLLSVVSLVAQIPFEPSGIARFNGWSYSPGRTFMFNPSDTSFWMPEQNRFILGSQWGTAERSVNRRLWMNTANEKLSYHIFADTIALKAATTGVGNIAVSFASEDIRLHNFGMAMQWDPEASLPDGAGYWEASPDDTLGACFGFYRKHGGYFAPGDASRYVLLSDSAAGSGDTGIVALSGIDYYPDMMRWESTDAALNGTRWYLAVNLRRANGLWDDSTAADDTVLTVRMPTRYKVTSSIKGYKHVFFDSVSVLTTGGGGVRTDATYFANGRWLDTKLTAATDSVFVIRRRMLPKYSDTSDITLAAFFRTAAIASANFGDSINRPFHVHGSGPAVGEVDSFDIEVRYHGKCDIAVNWVRLETPMARQVFRGQRDSLIATDYMKDVDSIMRRIRGHLPSARLWRIYGQDETPPPLQLFHRYLTFMFDRYLISEGPCYNRYRHAVPQRTYWGGALRPQTKQLSSYLTTIWTGTTNVYDGIALGLYGGHRRSSDYLGSNYDDGLPEWKTTFDTAGKANALNFMYLTVLDACAYERSRNLNFIYDDKPWTVNVHIMQQWRVKNFGGKPALVNEYERPQTGEEYRSTMWTNLLYGAKGFLYDRFVFDPLKDTTGQTDSALYTNNVSDMGITGGRYPGLAKSTLDNESAGDTVLFSNAAGTDFITKGNSSRLDQYIKFDSTAWYHGIDTNRIYIGLKSLRLEVRKIHDWIHAVSDTLMKLRLDGVYAKGYRTFMHGNNGDSALIHRYIDIDTTRLYTKPATKTKKDVWDSSHFDISLFHEAGRSPDSIFYVCFTNRRTSSLIQVPASHRPAWADTIGDSLAFYTTNEFDSLTVNSWGNVPDTAAAFWATQRFMQGGSRIVTLPFNYKDSLGRYALLRVRELGAGNAYLDSVYPYRNDKQLYDMVDTVVGQDKSITFKLLPGEGKIFRVEVLRSNEPKGDLSHSNQTKIVGHALMRRENGTGKWIEGDSTVYYMTYHRRISYLDRRNAVYFRAAQPTSRWDNNAALQWGEEYLLSDEVYHHGRWNTADTCAYPSIVVRFDSASQEYHAYVVFGCATPYNPGNGAMPDSQIIMETIVRLHADTIVEVLPSLYLAEAAGRPLHDWGTPMVNASDTANFYCYADKHRGIIAGWKPPDLSRSFVSTTRISWLPEASIAECSPVAQHPSLNPYSPYIRGEKHSDAALVWQERSCAMTRTQVHYTRLFITNWQIFHDLPPRVITAPFYANADTSIWCVSCDSLPPASQEQHYFPVVYRDLFHPDTSAYYCDWQGLFPGHSRHDLRTDNIGWHTTGETGYPPIPYSLISRRIAYSIDDTSGGGFVPDSLNAFPSETIWSAAYANLSGVNIAAGEAAYSDFPPMYGNTGGCLNYSDRSVALEFGYIPALQPFGQPLWSVIYSTGLPTWATLASIPLSEVAAGSSPHTAHLAARGTITLRDWQRGRHIYSADTSEAPPIRTSGRQFYKRANNGNPITETLWGFGDGERRFVLGAVQFQGRDYPFQPKRARLLPQLFVQPDTLVTAWFTVENRGRLRLTSAGNAPENVELWLERRSDGSRWLVPLEAGARRRLARLFVLLENGAGEEYRLEFLNATGGSFRREIALDADADGLGRGAEEDGWLINLGVSDAAQTLAIFPNPASDEVRIALRGEGAAMVEVVNMFGEIVWKTEATAGGVLTVRTADFPAGVYAVRVARTGLPAAAGRFVVAR